MTTWLVLVPFRNSAFLAFSIIRLSLLGVFEVCKRKGLGAAMRCVCVVSTIASARASARALNAGTASLCPLLTPLCPVCAGDAEKTLEQAWRARNSIRRHVLRVAAEGGLALLPAVEARHRGR